MLYQFPKTIFVKTVSVPDQIAHVRSEIDEIEAAYIEGNLPHAVNEIMDAHCSLETLTRQFVILASDSRTPVNPAAILIDVIDKNSKRRYHE
jgi:hypothetical protein